MRSEPPGPSPTAEPVRCTTLNAVFAGPILRDKVWFMTAHRRWGRVERIANLFHDTVLNDPFFTPADGTNGRPFDPADASEDLRSDDVRVTYQINQKNKVNGFYEWQRNNQPNNFAYLNAGVSSMESGNPYCNHPQLFMGTWNNTATSKLLFEGGVLLFNSWASTYDNPCAGIPTNRLYRDTALPFPFNGNGPSLFRTGQRPFKQRFSMTYLAGPHRIKTGFTADESLPYQSVRRSRSDAVHLHVQGRTADLAHRIRVANQFQQRGQDPARSRASSRRISGRCTA